MRWSQQDYEDADTDLVEEIRDVMREEYERMRPAGQPDDGDEDVEY